MALSGCVAMPTAVVAALTCEISFKQLRTGDAADASFCSRIWCSPGRLIWGSDGACATMLDSGSVVTWGNSRAGGDGCLVLHQLKNALPMQASHEAFATILGDGFVITFDNGAGVGAATRHAVVVIFARWLGRDLGRSPPRW